MTASRINRTIFAALFSLAATTIAAPTPAEARCAQTRICEGGYCRYEWNCTERERRGTRSYEEERRRNWEDEDRRIYREQRGWSSDDYRQYREYRQCVARGECR